MDESLARGHASKALRDATARHVGLAVTRAAGSQFPRNRKGQERWIRRVVSVAKPALIGKPVARYGKRFAFSLPLVEPSEGEIFGEHWKGIGLGQLTFTSEPDADRISSYKLLALDLHVLTRIGQRSGGVGLDHAISLLSPALPWCLAHASAAVTAGAERMWLPLDGGLLICRTVPAVKQRPILLFAATFLSEARLSPFKSRILQTMRAAQIGLAQPFPFLPNSDAGADDWLTAIERLLPIYGSLPDSQEDRAA